MSYWDFEYRLSLFTFHLLVTTPCFYVENSCEQPSGVDDVSYNVFVTSGAVPNSSTAHSISKT